jgi:hypothetical protein
MAPTPTQQSPPWWKSVWGLIVEIWVGSFLFAILFVPAVVLDLGIWWLKTSWEISEFLIGLLTWTKYLIAVIDAMLYVVFVVNMPWRFLIKLPWRKTDHA